MPTDNQDHTVDPTQALIAEIAEIVPLMKRLDAIGPGVLSIVRGTEFALRGNRKVRVGIFVGEADDCMKIQGPEYEFLRVAHMLITREAEEYLRGKGRHPSYTFWRYYSPEGSPTNTNPDGPSFSLASALAAQCEREGK